ncbi:DUF4328 domain-containing protein [Sphingopyxis sp.]|uniref:DUF4328 domain-containing protein n=1 Tax=Sphingopyxis sp. TaxID=1908224 RepID=UPI003BA8D90F
MAEMGLSEGIDLLQQRAKLLKFMLITGFVLIAAVLVGQLAELRGLVSLDPNIEMTSAAALYTAITLGDGLLALVTIIVFSMWIYRAAANVVAAEVHGFAYTAGWSVGWFFIPIANLFKPFAAMRQIWNASHGAMNERLDDGNGLLALWWGTWILSNIAANVSFRLSLNPSSVEEFTLGLQIGTVASAISLALYPAAYRLVDSITNAQRERLTAAHIFA